MDAAERSLTFDGSNLKSGHSRPNEHEGRVHRHSSRQRASERSEPSLAGARFVPVIGAVGGAVAFIGAGKPVVLGDEAASVMSAERSLPSLFAELGASTPFTACTTCSCSFWIGAFGTSEAVVRFPSAVAAGFAIAGTVALGRRLLGTTGGILAGAVIAVLPEFTRMAIEARSYAFSIALAVWLTWLLVVLVRRHETRKRLWLIYAVGAALGCVPLPLPGAARRRASRGR